MTRANELPLNYCLMTALSLPIPLFHLVLWFHYSVKRIVTMREPGGDGTVLRGERSRFLRKQIEVRTGK